MDPPPAPAEDEGRPRSPAIVGRMRVDFPMPGGPPRRITDPGTTPPPNTRSNSARPVAERTKGATRTSSKRTTSEEKLVIERLRTPAAERGGAMSSSSTKEFQCSHSGQRPSQRALEWPHSWQRNDVRPFSLVFIAQNSQIPGDRRCLCPQRTH